MYVVMDILDCKTRGSRSAEPIESGFFRQSAVLSNVINKWNAIKIAGENLQQLPWVHCPEVSS